MPELPEAETVRRQLEPQIVNSRIVAAWSRLPRLTFPSVTEFMERVAGRTIVAARRRGKQLYFPLDNDDALLVHLGMTGRLHVEPAMEPFDPDSLHKHIHAVVILEPVSTGQSSQGGRMELRFTDPRTFGSIGVDRELAFLSAMGPEPIDADFDEAALVAKLARKNVKIKAAILDQKLVAGLGNIYADEVCFLAGVHPEARACELPLDRLKAVVAHMRPVLQRAIAARGATLKDKGYQDTFGQHGEFLPAVYGRTGEACLNCGQEIRRGTLGPGKSARSYHYCPQCQPFTPR